MTTTTIYNKSFWNAMRGQKDAYSNLKDGADVTGGYTAPSEFMSNYTAALEKENLFRRLATVVRTTSAEGKIHAVASTGNADWVGENEAIPESTDTFTQFRLNSHKLASLSRLRTNFVMDNNFDIERYLCNEFARRFGRAEENSFINGNGENAPYGILHTTDGAEVGLTAASATALAFDEILKLYFSLKPEYRKGAVWLMNDETALYLRTLKDTNDNYLWQTSDNTIFGKPVVYSNHIPNIASGTKAIAFGDLSYYWIVDRKPLVIKILSEMFLREEQIGFAAYERLDGRLIRPEAIKLLQMAE